MTRETENQQDIDPCLARPETVSQQDIDPCPARPKTQ
jgi:hypothetical protein